MLLFWLCGINARQGYFICGLARHVKARNRGLLRPCIRTEKLRGLVIGRMVSSQQIECLFRGVFCLIPALENSHALIDQRFSCA
jgi:hypothetical protein